ncbi:MalY/PatB family protein [Acetonema longum]|uniref:cysteine-S-conjugate beta-lyase n=1 Tax=Acetonema longum DSM 6540 TaxID=1009370 RepID=F7NHF7_9FIRM|nr:PatB family C-S lyase [Acetonema longum]EGO64504.1 aminotransferase class I and II [Acetonema longum DSM 6540]
MTKIDFNTVINRRNSGSVKWDDADLLYGAKDVLPLWVADTDFPAPQAVLDALQARVAHGVFGYPSPRFLGFEALAGWLKQRHSWETKPEWMVNSPGVVTALSIAVQTLTAPGDKVIIQPPVYPHFFSAVLQNSRTVVENSLIPEDGRYRIDFDDLARKAADAKLLILCSPHNPVGRVWTAAELKKLAEIALSNNLIILSDEIHSDLVYPGHRHTPLASLGEDIARITVTCVAPSKTFNIAGLYTSAVVISDTALRKRFADVIQALSLTKSNVFGSAALEAAYKHGGPWLEQLLPFLAANAAYLVERFSRETPKIKVNLPEGTFLAWLDCRALGLNNDALSDFFAKEARVGLNRGYSFGAQGSGFMRLNFGCSRAVLTEAIDRITRAYQDRGF